MKIVLVIAGTLISLVFLIVVVSLVLIHYSDGPNGPIPGGKLVSGELVNSTNINWLDAVGNQPIAEIELELTNTASSRTTGAFVHEGNLYVPCDLGYVWRRLPNGSTRLILHTIWLFKNWHEKIAQDNNVVVRTNGKRYQLKAVRVTDEKLMAQFRDRVSEAAGKAFELLPVATNPDEIWFFQLLPRST